MLNEMANECLGAQWVRAKGESADALDRTQAVLFRLEIEVNAPVKRAEIRISAADRYRLYVNGESVVCGPRKGDALNRYFETVDLAPYLKSGRNALTARVISYAYDCATGGIDAPKSVYVAPTGAVLMCRGEVETLEGKIALSTGEANWTACQDESFALHSEGAVYVGADSPRGWTGQPPSSAGPSRTARPRRPGGQSHPIRPPAAKSPAPARAAPSTPG